MVTSLKYRRLSTFSVSLILLLLWQALFTAGCRINSGVPKIPVIYCSDLFHPHDDPDDHFDIVSIYALEELDIKGIILDQGARQKSAPGRIPVEQLNYISGRNIPTAPGLSDKLISTVDNGLNQDVADQAGIEMILEILGNSADPVTIVTVGSLRDVAAAFNRDPELFARKVGKLLVFIGEASAGTLEWNVGLDPHAFQIIMNSGLPVWWVPCFDGGNFKNNGNASFWRADHKDILKYASDRIINFFIYGLLKKDDPGTLAFLDKNVNPADKEEILAPTRNLWCTAVFTAITGKKIVKRGDEYLALQQHQIKQDDDIVEPFIFMPVSLYIDDEARVVYEKSCRSREVMRFRRTDRKLYAEIMTSVTAYLIGSFDN